MKNAIALILCAVTLYGSWIWYERSLPCARPIPYTLGDLDARFPLAPQDAQEALRDAERIWEDVVGLNLFEYTDNAPLKVHFIYDERQERTDHETVDRMILERKQFVHEHLYAEYESLQDEYETLRSEYDTKKKSYEVDLVAYNNAVEAANARGGATEKEYAAFSKTKQDLEKRDQELRDIVRSMNRIIGSLNRLSNQGAEAVSEYNETVASYNEVYGERVEFVQGEYLGDRIHIYQFGDGEELRRVLTHELGHALGLEHVDSSEAIMHYLMEGGVGSFTLSEADKEEIRRTCRVDA